MSEHSNPLLTARLGHINFANSLPVYEALLNQRVSVPAKIISEVPANLNRMILAGELDISPVSSVVYAQHQDQLSLVKGLCINSYGAVYSVILAGDTPLEAWGGHKIGLTANSATAAILTKILLKDYYHFENTYQAVPFSECGKLDGVVAELIIGDAAFLLRDRFQYCYDLADLWLQATKQAIVFAVWVVRTEFAKRSPLLLAGIEEALLESYHQTNRKNVLSMAKKVLKLDDAALNRYFEALGYDFNSQMQEALLYFYQRASNAGLVPACPNLHFWRA